MPKKPKNPGKGKKTQPSAQAITIAELTSRIIDMYDLGWLTRTIRHNVLMGEKGLTTEDLLVRAGKDASDVLFSYGLSTDDVVSRRISCDASKQVLAIAREAIRDGIVSMYEVKRFGKPSYEIRLNVGMIPSPDEDPLVGESRRSRKAVA